MSDWQRTLDIHESWVKAEKDELPAHILAKEIAEKLRALKPFPENSDANSVTNYINWKLDEVAREFENIAEEEEDDTEWFDIAMYELYNWADISLDGRFGGKKNCWVRTAF